MGAAGGFFFKAISPRSVKSYSHLAEIKDISVRGSWQGLSTVCLALGFRFPTWIGCWGERRGSPLTPSAQLSKSFPVLSQEGPGMGCAQ